jgi:hypothetical protein
MVSRKRQSLWKRRFTIGPAAATLLGVALGCAVSTAGAFLPPAFFSWSDYSILLLFLVPITGLSGYILWLTGDPARHGSVQKITQLVAFPAILALLVAFPKFWLSVVRAVGPGCVLMCMGFIYLLVMYVVAAGMSVTHFGGYLGSFVRRGTKVHAKLRTDGVWDWELDQG